MEKTADDNVIQVHTITSADFAFVTGFYVTHATQPLKTKNNKDKTCANGAAIRDKSITNNYQRFIISPSSSSYLVYG